MPAFSQERWQVEHQQIQGSATALGITPGHTFTLYNAPFFSDNAEYLTTEANYWLEENAYASGGSSQTMHRIDFTVIPSSVTYRPAQKIGLAAYLWATDRESRRSAGREHLDRSLWPGESEVSLGQAGKRLTIPAPAGCVFPAPGPGKALAACRSHVLVMKWCRLY